MDSDQKPFIGVFTTSTELIVRVWDDAIAAMTGIAAEAAVGKHIEQLIPDLASRGLLTRFQHVRDYGTSEVLAPALHKNLFPCPPQNRSERFDEMRQLVTISALYNEDEIDGLIVVIEDVTPRMEREKALAEDLKSPDATLRLRAAKSIAAGGEALGRDEAEPLIEALADKNWRVRRRLVDGLARRAAPEAVAALLEAVKKDHFDFGMLNGALQVLQATSIDTTGTLLEFLRSDDDDLRMQAALALGQQKNPAAVEYLIAALDDPNANVRYHAIEALGNFQTRAAVEPLMAIAESRDFFLSFAALDALKQIADPSIAPRVTSLLEDELLCEAAAATLGVTGDIDSVEAIVELLNDGRLSATVASQALCSLLERHAAVETSGASQVIDRFLQTLHQTGTTALVDAVNNADASPDNNVVKVAGWVSDKRIVDGLLSLLEKEPSREAALSALIGQGDAASPALIEKLKEGDGELRAQVAIALGSIGNETSVEALITTLHSDSSIAPLALEALGKSSSPQALQALIGLLASPDKALRRATVNTLKRFPPENAFSRWDDLLKDGDPNLRESAVRLVGDLKTPESEPAILARTEDEDETVRIAALEQLQGFQSGAAVGALKRALEDVSPRVRAAAVQALAGFSDEESIHTLNQALTDSDSWVRYFAIRSLAANGGANRSAEVFRNLAEQDPAEQVRVAAAEAISGAAA